MLNGLIIKFPFHSIFEVLTPFDVKMGIRSSSSIIPLNDLLMKIESLPVATPIPILKFWSSIFDMHFSYDFPL